jgi:hypothetical protein
MMSVALPATIALPSTPTVSEPSSTSSRFSTMSTISSTSRPIERLPSAKTRTGWRPSLRITKSGSIGTSGISLPRYCTRSWPLDISTSRALDPRRAR